jgi:hypothetical protein
VFNTNAYFDLLIKTAVSMSVILVLLAAGYGVVAYLDAPTTTPSCSLAAGQHATTAAASVKGYAVIADHCCA